MCTEAAPLGTGTPKSIRPGGANLAKDLNPPPQPPSFINGSPRLTLFLPKKAPDPSAEKRGDFPSHLPWLNVPI